MRERQRGVKTVCWISISWCRHTVAPSTAPRRTYIPSNRHPVAPTHRRTADRTVVQRTDTPAHRLTVDCTIIPSYQRNATADAPSPHQDCAIAPSQHSTDAMTPHGSIARRCSFDTFSSNQHSRFVIDRNVGPMATPRWAARGGDERAGAEVRRYDLETVMLEPKVADARWGTLPLH